MRPRIPVICGWYVSAAPTPFESKTHPSCNVAHVCVFIRMERRYTRKDPHCHKFSSQWQPRFLVLIFKARAAIYYSTTAYLHIFVPILERLAPCLGRFEARLTQILFELPWFTATRSTNTFISRGKQRVRDSRGQWIFVYERRSENYYFESNPSFSSSFSFYSSIWKIDLILNFSSQLYKLWKNLPECVKLTYQIFVIPLKCLCIISIGNLNSLKFYWKKSMYDRYIYIHKENQFHTSSFISIKILIFRSTFFSRSFFLYIIYSGYKKYLHIPLFSNEAFFIPFYISFSHYFKLQ